MNTVRCYLVLSILITALGGCGVPTAVSHGREETGNVTDVGPLAPAAPLETSDPSNGTSSDLAPPPATTSTASDELSADPDMPQAPVLEPDPPILDQAQPGQDPIDPTLLFLDPLDPLGSLLFDPTSAPAVLSAFVDGLALDLMSPFRIGDGVTFLELLCRDSSIPEFRCRQRFSDQGGS